MVGGSVNSYTKEILFFVFFLALNLSLGHSHTGACFTNEEQKKVGPYRILSFVTHAGFFMM